MTMVLEDLYLAVLVNRDPVAADALCDLWQMKGMIMLTVGQAYLIRTAKYIYTGRVVESGPFRTVLEDAAWIADTGRFHEALTKGSLNEVEPFPDGVTLNTLMIEDAAPWRHALPRKAV